MESKLIFGGYDGTGDSGYKNDMGAIINIEQPKEEIETIKSWLRWNMKNTMGATIEAQTNVQVPRLNESLVQHKREMSRLPKLFQSTYNRSHPYPWDAEQVLGTGLNHDKYFNEKYWNFARRGKPWKKGPVWVPVLTIGKRPSPRHRHACAALGPYFVVFGGFGPSGFLNDVHILNSKTMTWLSQKIHGTPPIPRAGATLTRYSSKLIVYGGYNSGVAFVDGISVLDMNCKTGMAGGKTYGKPICSGRPMMWRALKVTGPAPTPRFGHAALVVSSSSKLLILGGFGGSANGDWLQRSKLAGYRMDKSVLNLGTPIVHSISVFGKNAEFRQQKNPFSSPPDKVEGVGVFTKSWIAPASDYSPPIEVYPKANGRTQGDLLLRIKGENFGVEEVNYKPVAVTLGNSKFGPFPCAPLTWVSATEIKCIVSPGVGRNLDVTVFSNDQNTLPGNRMFSYDPPYVHSVIPPFLVDFSFPKGAPSAPRGPFLILGRNFGPEQRFITSITFGGASCLKWKYISHSAIMCLCVGRSKKDLNGDSLQGGVTVKVGGQFSNDAPFLLVSAPHYLSWFKPGVGYPVSCPTEAMVEALAYKFQHLHEYPDKWSTPTKKGEHPTLLKPGGPLQIVKNVTGAFHYYRKRLLDSIWDNDHNHIKYYSRLFLSAFRRFNNVLTSNENTHKLPKMEAAMNMKAEAELKLITAFPKGTAPIEHKETGEYLFNLSGKANKNMVKQFPDAAEALEDVFKRTGRRRRRLMSTNVDRRIPVVEVRDEDVEEDHVDRLETPGDIRQRIQSWYGVNHEIPENCTLIFSGKQEASVSPACNCGAAIMRLRAAGNIQKSDISNVCLSAISQHAWARSCNESRTAYEQACKGSPTQNVVQNAGSSFIRFFKRLPSFRSNCRAFAQLTNLMCSAVMGSKFTPVSVERNVKVNWFPESMTALGSFKREVSEESCGRSCGVPSGDFMRFQSFGSSSRGVYFIHPSIKKFVPPQPSPLRKKSRRNHAPVLEMNWIRNDNICASGKPPSARRSFTLTTLLDGKTHVLFGGMGLDAGGGPLMDPADMKNVANQQEIEPNLLHMEQYFNETYLLSDLSNLLALNPANVEGLGMNSTHCKARFTPVPPAYKPPMRPFMVRVIDTDAPDKAKNILAGKYMSVGDLKESIEVVMNVSLGNRSLSFNGNLLVDDAIKLGYAEMGDGDTVNIVNVLTPPPPPKDEEPEPPSPDDLLQGKGMDPPGNKKRKNEKAKSKAGGGLLASLMKPIIKGVMAALPKVPPPTMPEILPPRVPALPLSPPKVPSLPSIPKIKSPPKVPPATSPKAPGLQPSTQVPEMPNIPGSPPTAGMPNVPGAPPTPDTPKIPGAPPVPGASVPSNPPSVPDTPGGVGASPAAGASKVPGARLPAHSPTKVATGVSNVPTRKAGTPNLVPLSDASPPSLTPQVASVKGSGTTVGGALMSPKEALLHANKGKEDTANDMSPFITAHLGNDAVESPVSQPELHQVVKEQHLAGQEV
jgi:hypothetical protein